MKTLELLGQTHTLETNQMHIAPGGSVIFTLSGEPKIMAKCLKSLREELAYGMLDAKSDVEAVTVSLYLGLADVDDFTKTLAGCDDAQAVQIERVRDVKEDASIEALSMASRNKVIDSLG